MLLYQPFQTRTIPRPALCPCLMNALLFRILAKLWAFNFGHPCPSLVKGEVLSPEKIRATTGGIASRCTKPLRPYNHCKRTTTSRPVLNLPPLSKVRCCRPKKFGRLPEGLPPVAPNLSIPTTIVKER